MSWNATRSVCAATLVTAILTALLARAAGARAEAALPVRIVDATSGEALRGTDVVVALEGGRVPAAQRAPWSQLLRSDDDGFVHVTGGRAATDVFVQRGETSARAHVDDEGTIAFLVPQGTVAVRALDADGRPAPGVVVTLEPSGRPGAPAPRATTSGPFAVAALVTGFPPQQQEWGVRSCLDVAPRERASRDGHATTLRLGPTTRIDVAVSGLRSDDAADAWVRADGHGRDDDSALRVPVIEGRAQFDRVPCGRDLFVAVRAADASRPTARAHVRTDTSGTPAALRVEVARVRLVIVGRCTDPDGEPLEGVPVCATLERFASSRAPAPPPEPGGSADASTSADGAFRIEFDRAADTLTHHRLAFRTVRADEEHPSACAQRLGVAYGPAPDDGVVDVGVFVRPAARDAVSGTVVDAAGRPLAQAHVALGGTRADGTRENGLEHTSTDDLGRFRILPPVGATHLAVSASKGRHVGSARVDAERGDDVRLVLAPAARILCRLPLHPFAVLGAGASERPRVIVERGTPPVNVGGWATKLVDGDVLELECDGLAPGPATLRVTWRCEDLVPPRQVDLRAGETWPFGKRALDLAVYVRTFRVTVLDAVGAPAADAELLYRPQGVAYAWGAARTDSDGRATLLLVARPLDVRVVGREHDASAFAGSVAESAVLRLERFAARVDVPHAPQADSVRARGMELRCHLVWMGPPGAAAGDAWLPHPGMPGELTGTPDDAGERFAVTEPGLYAAIWGLECPRLGTFIDDVSGAPAYVTVRKNGEVLSLDAAPDPAALAAAVLRHSR